MVKGITSAGEVPDDHYSIQNWLHEIVNTLLEIRDSIKETPSRDYFALKKRLDSLETRLDSYDCGEKRMSGEEEAGI